MSETKQSDEMHTRLQPHQNPQAPQPSEVVVDDTATQPTYAGADRLKVTHFRAM
jgi:hypothetical protein